MNKQFKKIIQISLPLLLGVFLVYYAFSRFTSEQFAQMFSDFKNANYQYIALCSALSIVALWARAFRWKYALKHMGYQSDTLTNFMAISIGYLLNLTLPRSGEFSRAVVLQRCKNIPFDKSFGSIVSERLIDFFCLLCCVLLALILQWDILKDFLLAYISLNEISFLVAALVVSGLIFVLFIKYCSWRIVLLFKAKISGLLVGVSSVFLMQDKWKYALLTLLIWFSYIGTFYIAIFSLEQTSSLSFSTVLAAFVAGSFAISFTNGGFGAFPLIVAQLLVLYGIPLVSGIAFGWILWTTQTLIIVVLGGLSFLFLSLFYSKKSK